MIARTVGLSVQGVQPELWLTPQQKLRVLKREAHRLGISKQAFSETQAIGSRESQIQDQTARLQEWINSARINSDR